jgi:hypothetical protein
MAEHLRLFWELFRDDPRLRFHTMFPGNAKKNIARGEIPMNKLLPVQEINETCTYTRNWDLIVLPGHSPRLLMTLREVSAVYIGHGPQNKQYADTEETGAYGRRAFDRKGRPLYRLMLEVEKRSRDLIVESIPSLKGVIVVVGSTTYDKLLAQRHRREEFRQRFGFKPHETVVFVMSSWRQECLFETVGDKLLKESRELLGEFRFMLTVHPNEYRPKPPGQRVWGQYLRTQRKHGFIVREPSEDWLPYMLACDIIITDHTSLLDYGVLLEKPTILVPVPEKFIWKGSITWKLRKFAPIIEDMAELQEFLLKAKNDYPTKKLKELSRSMNPFPGKSGDRIRKEIYDLLNMDPFNNSCL